MATERPGRSPLHKSYLDKKLNSYAVVRRPTQGYLEKYQKKVNLTATNITLEMNYEKLVQPNLRHIRYRNAIYQGHVVYHLASQSNMRHGEGVILLHDGTTIIGRWQHNRLEGPALIYCPEGGTVYCQFVGDRPNGWMIYEFQQRYIICELYHLGKLKEGRYTYETHRRSWVYSYRNESKTQSCEYGRLPQLIASQQLQKKLADFYRREYRLSVQSIHIIQTDQLLYVGFVDRAERPEGLGIIHSELESYAGYFRGGSLHYCGRIVFANGDIYSGQFRKGAIEGEGAYYNFESDNTVLSKHHYRTNKIEKQVMKQSPRTRANYPIPFAALPEEQWIDFDETISEDFGLDKVRSVMAVWVQSMREQKNRFEVKVHPIEEDRSVQRAPEDLEDDAQVYANNLAREQEYSSIREKGERANQQAVYSPSSNPNRLSPSRQPPPVLQLDYESVALGPTTEADGLHIPQSTTVNVSLKQQEFDTLAGNNTHYDLRKAQLTFRRHRDSVIANPFQQALEQQSETSMKELNEKLETLITSIPKKKRIFGATNITRINFE